MGVWLSKAFWATLVCLMPAPLPCLSEQGVRAFTLECGYLHVYVWQELTVRLGLSLLSMGLENHLNIFSVMLLWLSYRDLIFFIGFKGGIFIGRGCCGRGEKCFVLVGLFDGVLWVKIVLFNDEIK